MHTAQQKQHTCPDGRQATLVVFFCSTYVHAHGNTSRCGCFSSFWVGAACPPATTALLVAGHSKARKRGRALFPRKKQELRSRQNGSTSSSVRQRQQACAYDSDVSMYWVAPVPTLTPTSEGNNRTGPAKRKTAPIKKTSRRARRKRNFRWRAAPTQLALAIAYWPRPVVAGRQRQRAGRGRGTLGCAKAGPHLSACHRR